METLPIHCPRCSRPWPATPEHVPGPQACPQCGAWVRTELFPALARSLGPNIDPATASAPASLAGAGEAVCYQHSQRKAVVPCDACGRLLCGLCDLSLGDLHLCPGCFDAARQDPDGVLPRSRTLFGRSALFLACIPMFPPTALVAIAVAIAGRKQPGSLLRPRRWQLHAAWILATLQLVAFAGVMVAVTAR